MKRSLIISIAILATASMVSAQTILIDYAGRTGSNTTVLDGDFGSGGAILWQPIDESRAVSIKVDETEGTGTAENIIIGITGDGSSTELGVWQNTGYDLVEGDVFDFSLDWRDSFQWDDGSDQVTFELFYTSDDTINGTRTSIFFDSFIDAVIGGDEWQTDTGTMVGTVTASAAGRDLFVEISTTAAAANGDFARLDNVYLNVTSVPEPSTYALIVSLFGIACVIARRRS